MFVNIIIGLLGLGLVVVIHEAGHLLAARAVGIDVEIFSVGWGKRIWGIKWRGTEYRFSILPIGGYVRLRGMDAHRTSHAFEHNAFPSIEGGFFDAHPLKRIIVALGGPLANIIIAFIIFAMIFAIGYTYRSYGNKIVLASEVDGMMHPADVGGLQTGDIIAAIDETPITHFTEIREQIATTTADHLLVTVERAGAFRTLSVPIEQDSGGLQQIGIFPWVRPLITNVDPDSPADIAGIEAGDLIVSIDNSAIDHTIDILKTAVAESVITIQVDRGGETLSFVMPVGETSDGDPYIGVNFTPPSARQQPARLDIAFARAARNIGSIFTLTFKGINYLFRGGQLLQTVAGPIQMTALVGEATRSGDQGLLSAVRRFFDFIAIVSVALAIMNLLPIPVLDGGQVAIYLYEIARRKPLTPTIVRWYQIVGFAMVILLLMVALFSDIIFLLR